MDEIQIVFRHRPNMWAEWFQFQQWFPRIMPQAHDQPWIDAEALALGVYEELGLRVRLSVKSVRSTLQSLFGVFKSNWRFGHNQHGSTKRKVQRILEKQINQDLEHSRFRGLYRSRHRFLTLCVVARFTDSFPLAEALVSFFYDYLHYILRNEDASLLLREWAVGIHELRPLISEETFIDLMYHLSQKANKMNHHWHNAGWNDPVIESILRTLNELMNQMGRGRHPRRAYLEYQPRAITAPPMHRYPPRLALPAPIEPMYSPFPSPALSAPIHDENEFRFQMLENQVQELQEEVATRQPLLGFG